MTNGLNPVDLGLDDERDDTAETTVEGVALPQPKIDGRTKEGRAARRAAIADETEATTLFGDAERRGPGRPRKSAGKNVDSIKKVLISVHLKAAIATGVPEVAIDEDEATQLAESGAALLEYYKIRIDGKRGAMLAFLYALTLVYGPRIFAYIVSMRQQSKEDAEKEPEPVNANVAEFPLRF